MKRSQHLDVHLLDSRRAVGVQDLALEVLDQRRGLLMEDLEALHDRAWGIVGALLQTQAILVADSVVFWRAEDGVACVAVGALPPAADALDRCRIAEPQHDDFGHSLCQVVGDELSVIHAGSSIAVIEPELSS